MTQTPRTAVTIISLLMGISILMLAVPNTMASFTMLDTAPLRARLQKHHVLSNDELILVREAQIDALGWIGSSQIQQDLVTVELGLAKTIDDEHQKKTFFELAKHSIEQGLLRSPADPAAWARLSFLKIQNNDSRAEARESLVMSLLIGPNEKPLVFSRINYGIILWAELDEDERSLINEQIIIADRLNRPRLIKLSRKSDNSMKIILTALTHDLERFTGFVKSLNK